jgi:two-component system, OmpR family, KDP operon response regulator KdpE
LAKVLVVDDDPQFRRTLRLALTVYGYQVGEAANGFEAMEQMCTSSVDIVLLDWQMPGMGGEEVCQAIRAVSRVPIIVVSAFDRGKEAQAHGLSGSLTKPIHIDTLVRSIDFALRS